MHDWLKEISNPKSSKQFLRQPCGVVLDGVPHAFASDGILAVLLPGGDFPPSEMEADLAKIVALLAVTRAPLGWSTAEAVVAWAGPWEGPHAVPCEQCGGDGCGHCDGSGKALVEAPIRPGFVGLVMIDRNRLAYVMGRFTGRCQVTISEANKNDGSQGIVDFIGSDWRVLMASCLNYHSEDCPRLEIVEKS